MQARDWGARAHRKFGTLARTHVGPACGSRMGRIPQSTPSLDCRPPAARYSSAQDAGSAVRSWRAQEEWLTWPRFHAQLHTAYGPLLNCDSWKVGFDGRRHRAAPDGVGVRSGVQAGVHLGRVQRRTNSGSGRL